MVVGTQTTGRRTSNELVRQPTVVPSASVGLQDDLVPAPAVRRAHAKPALPALEHAREKGYKRIRGRLPQNNEVALSFLSSIGALVPLYNPEARFELPL